MRGCERVAESCDIDKPLNLRGLFRLVRECVCDTHVSNETLLNDLLEPYVRAAGVKARGGKEFHLDKSRASRLLSGKDEIPVALARELARLGLREQVAKEMSYFREGVLDPERLGYLHGVLSSAMGGGDEVEGGEGFSPEKLDDLLAQALIAAIKTPNKKVGGIVLVEFADGHRVDLIAGDLVDMAFRPKPPRGGAFAIPVDSAFCTEISEDLEGASSLAVSSKTIHGQFLQSMERRGVDSSELKGRIRADLTARGISDGGQEGYPLGTVALLEHGGAAFLLVACSVFDDSGVASLSLGDLPSVLDALLGAHDTRCQGRRLFIPLIGTGLSRAGIGRAESVGLIRNALLDRGRIPGDVSVVVLPDSFDEVKRAVEGASADGL